MDKSSMLIDFSSPAHKNELALPLIPMPPQVPLPSEEVGEPSVDPFDVQATAAPDPFEVVLQCVANSSNSEKPATEKPQLSFDMKTEKILIQIQSEDSDIIETLNVENPEEKESVSFSSCDNVLSKTPIESDQVSSRNEIPKDCKVDLEKSHNITQVRNKAQDALKNSSKLLVSMECDSQSRLSGDFSTEESLKAVIAKRVNRCIQETLNGSMKTNKNCDNSMFNKPQNKRSLSFIGLSSASAKKECDRLNKSCTDVDDTFNLEDQQLEASSDSSGFGLLSPSSTDVSTEGNEEDNLFREARKLSRTFSKFAESFRQEQESDSEDEDLMSCKPRWLYTDSSEDEEEKLRNDPALNFRRRSEGSAFNSPALAPTNAKVLDSPALLAYKSRRSFTQLQAALNITQEELTMKRSISVGSQLKEIPVIPTLVTTGPGKLMKTDDQPLKLRKKNFGDMKKGPLRAVMPVQCMTKELMPVAGKTSSKQDTSPETRIQKAVYVLGTPNKDNSQLNLTPMASSTPNKADSFVSSKANASLLLRPVASVAANKRHSLEGSFGSHQSRGAEAEAGARPRSNSVNSSSSIPRVMQVKPLRGLPLAPKSTSSLARAQMNANNVLNCPEKKNTSHLKTNVTKARVLADVKTKSPLQRKVRTAVNTISSLVRGKKSAASDKENRVPA